MNILMVYQSVVDMLASFFTLLTAVVEVDGTHMSHDSVWDQFVCHAWLLADNRSGISRLYQPMVSS